MYLQKLLKALICALEMIRNEHVKYTLFAFQSQHDRLLGEDNESRTKVSLVMGHIILLISLKFVIVI